MPPNRSNQLDNFEGTNEIGPFQLDFASQIPILSEINARFREINARLEKIEAVFREINARKDEMIARLEKANKQLKFNLESIKSANEKNEKALYKQTELERKFDQIANESEIEINEVGQLKLIENDETKLIENETKLIIKESELKKEEKLIKREHVILSKQGEFVGIQSDLANQIFDNYNLADLVVLKLVTKEKIIQILNQFSNQLKEATDDKERIFEDAHDLITELCNLTLEENDLSKNDSILNIDNYTRLKIINKLNKNLYYAILNSIQIEDKTNLINENEALINLLVQVNSLTIDGVRTD